MRPLRDWFIRNKRPTLLALFLFFLTTAILIALFSDGGIIFLLNATGAFLTGCVLFWRASRFLIRRSIWRLRNRLIMTYVFIGFVPLVLVVVLVLLGGYILAGQTAMYLVSSELDRTMDTLRIPSRVLLLNPQARHEEVLGQIARFLEARFDTFEVVIREPEGIAHYPRTSQLQPAGAGLPDYLGLTVRNGRYFAWSHTENKGVVIDVVAPVDRELLAGLVPHLGKVVISGENAFLPRRHKFTSDDLRRGEVDALPPAANQFDLEVQWLSGITVAPWTTAQPSSSHLLWIYTRPSALIGSIFGEKFKLAQGLLFVLVLVAILFLIVEMISAVIGWSLARTITSAMQDLYNGTRRVAAGDFSHRIHVKGRDQLAAVTESFNTMTGHLERLVLVEKEKERLQSELEIAREVQNQLFPRFTPQMATLEITGLCRPASMVSGDYYDFLSLERNNVAIAIGDVAGKGISAALLMASIQSIMRTQLSAAYPSPAITVNGACVSPCSTSAMVSQLNRQLFQSTSPEKYATFMFGVYDETDRVFTYTNAGHLPSILIRRGEATLLEVTGTVVGAFPSCVYQEQKVRLEQGDLLVSYTDGITEPENAYGEEFGADRLVETILKNQKLNGPDLMNCVMDAVRSWTTAPELPDDMTLVLARSTA